jgi:Leucine-rich repeat (LRR) protein
MTRPNLKVLNNNNHFPEDLRHVTELHITAKISELSAQDFRGLSDVKSLTIGPEIDEIPAFSNFRATRHLTVLPPGLFGSLRSLRRLTITMKGLVAIASGAFEGLEKLEQLNLSENHIQIIEPGAFRGLTRLQVLNLSRNRITRIKREYFRPLRALALLDLSHNAIREVERGSFGSLHDLIILRLHGNRVSRPPSEIELQSYLG